MAEIAPLSALRYDLSRLSKDGGLGAVVAPPYDVIGPEERAALAARDPHNIVNLILPEGEGDAKYARAAQLFTAWRNKGTLVRDEEPGFYRYEQTFTPPGGGASKTRRGFLGLVKIVGLHEKIVLPHERTLSGPKEDRLKLFRATRTNLSPGFMLYRDSERAIDSAIDSATPITEFRTPDGILHRFGKVAGRDAVRAIVDGVAKSSLLIADGHHRYETALRYMEETTSTGGQRQEHHFFMVFFCNGDDPNLVVFPTHRHVHSLAAFDFDALVEGARSLFDVSLLPGGASAADMLSTLGSSGGSRPSLVACAADGRAALFVLRADVDLGQHPLLGQKPDVLRRTDVALLHLGVLEPVLRITPEMQAAKQNIWYPQDAAQALDELRRGKGQVLFLMNATPTDQVCRVAEAGEVMPQKSTFFYPKIVTGLCIHTLEPARSVATV